MPKIYIVILLSSLLLQGAVYEGKIGKYPIVMPLGEESELYNCYHKDDNSYHFALYPADSDIVAVRLIGMGHASFACELEPIALIPLNEMKPFTTQEALKYYPKNTK